MFHASSRLRFRAPLAAALALGLSGLLAVPSGAAMNDPSDLVEGCDKAPSASSKFSDYGTLDRREKDVVDCLAAGYKGDKSDTDFVLQGSGGKLNFEATISRAQFAAILNRAADYLGVPSKTGNPSKPTFADVPSAHFFFGEIEELFLRGLTEGSGFDVDDVDHDGDTSERVYNPNGQLSYAQVLAFAHRLLVDGAGEPLASDQSHGQAQNLDCGFFNDKKTALDNAGFLISANTPADCRTSAPRGLVFDLIAVAFDETVESGKITNPFLQAAGTITLTLDKSTAFTNEAVTATVTVLDSQAKPIVGKSVDVFAVPSTGGFDATGNPKSDGFANVGGTNRYGTGNQPAQIDQADPTTNASGVVTTSIMTNSTSSVTYDVYAFIGNTAVVYKDVKGTADATPKKAITFKGVPASILVTSQASPTNTLKYGTGHVVNYQLADATGKPVEVADVKIIAELYRTDDCAGAPSQSAPCNGVTRLFAVQTLVTDAKGQVNWSVAGAPDPIPTNGSNATTGGTGQPPCNPSAGVCEDGGDQTTDAFRGTWDQNNNGAADDSIKTAADFVMKFLDAPTGKVEVATVKFLASNNPNKLDETGARLSTTVSMQVNVSDVYGNPAEGVGIQFARSALVDPEATIFTGSTGIAVFSKVGPATAADYNYTATIDANRDGAFGLSELKASSPRGTTTMSINWVGEPGVVATYANQNVVGFGTGYVDLDAAAVRAPYDDGDTFRINGEVVSMAAFAAAIQNDVESNDRITVNPYQAGGVSQWSMTVNGAAGPVG